MKEDLENDLIEDEDACDNVKNDSKSSHVYLTQPSDDLNRKRRLSTIETKRD